MSLELKYVISNNSIDTDHYGVQEVLRFYEFAKSYRFCKIELNLHNLNNFDANLSCLLMAIVYKLKQENKLYIYVNFPAFMHVLFRNGLVCHLSGKGNKNSYVDERESTISLCSFNVEDDDGFIRYINNDFLSHRGLNNLTSREKQNIRNHYIEIFNNVFLHAKSQYPVYACGQYYPRARELKFSLIDLGCGFTTPVECYSKGAISTDIEALRWSVTDNNSTKDVDLYGPGGTGLKELKNYCSENNGSFQICSGKGFLYVTNAGELSTYQLEHSLSGSLINVIFRNI